MISAQILIAIALLCQDAMLPSACKAELVTCYIEETGNSSRATDMIATKCIARRFKK